MAWYSGFQNWWKQLLASLAPKPPAPVPVPTPVPTPTPTPQPGPIPSGTFRGYANRATWWDRGLDAGYIEAEAGQMALAGFNLTYIEYLGVASDGGHSTARLAKLVNLVQIFQRYGISVIVNIENLNGPSVNQSWGWHQGVCDAVIAALTPYLNVYLMPACEDGGQWRDQQYAYVESKWTGKMAYNKGPRPTSAPARYAIVDYHGTSLTTVPPVTLKPGQVALETTDMTGVMKQIWKQGDNPGGSAVGIVSALKTFFAVGPNRCAWGVGDDGAYSGKPAVYDPTVIPALAVNVQPAPAPVPASGDAIDISGVNIVSYGGNYGNPAKMPIAAHGAELLAADLSNNGNVVLTKGDTSAVCYKQPDGYTVCRYFCFWPTASGGLTGGSPDISGQADKNRTLEFIAGNAPNGTWIGSEKPRPGPWYSCLAGNGVRSSVVRSKRDWA